MKNRRKQGKIFRSLLAVLMLTAMLVTSVLQPVFAGDYVAGTMFSRQMRRGTRLRCRM